jgi:hypothetical protein
MIYNSVINPLSFGQVSLNVLRELRKQKVNVNFFPIGENLDFNAFDKLEECDKNWIISSMNSRMVNYVDEPSLKLWHINGSESRYSSQQYLYTFYEANAPTQTEINLVKAQKHVFFSSSHGAKCFKDAGCNNVSFVPVGFDPDFQVTNQGQAGILHFGLTGKLEARKNTQQIITNWLNKYGNKDGYLLTCLVNNPFFPPEKFQQILAHTLGNVRWKNINFLPVLNQNSQVNNFINSIDIDLSGLSSSEGWGIPNFTSACFNKVVVATRGPGHEDWMDDAKHVVECPFSGERSVEDGAFFSNGGDFNQGTFKTISNEDMFKSFEDAEDVFAQKNGRELNEEMIKKFSYSEMVSKILTEMNK